MSRFPAWKSRQTTASPKICTISMQRSICIIVCERLTPSVIIERFPLGCQNHLMLPLADATVPRPPCLGGVTRGAGVTHLRRGERARARVTHAGCSWSGVLGRDSDTPRTGDAAVAGPRSPVPFARRAHPLVPPVRRSRVPRRLSCVSARVRGPPSCVNTIFPCHRDSSWMPGHHRPVWRQDGWSRLSLSVATEGASVDTAFFSPVRPCFTDGGRPPVSPMRLHG